MIFEVTEEHIKSLTDPDLRELIGLLAIQEALKAGYPISGITYGGDQNAKDGGIDVRVDLGEVGIDGFIPKSQTGFQVKAEDMPEGAITEEMRPSGNLRPSIKELGEKNGAYIIVSSKGTLSDTFLNKRRNAMSSAFSGEPDTSTLYTDFYDRKRLTTWVNQYPGLVAWVRTRVGFMSTGWRPFSDWSSSPGKIDEGYFVDGQVRLVSNTISERDGLSAIQGIEKIRTILAKGKGAVRLVGLSGVGKTRFVQALFDQKIGSNSLDPYLAVYTDMSFSPSPSPLDLLLHFQSLGQRCVLIVDNCGSKLHRDLVSAMQNSEGAVSLISIEYDISEDEPEHTDTFKLEPSSGEVIEQILKRKYPYLSSPEIRTITEFSEGNARIALALAETAKHGDSLANLKDKELIKRLFYQNHQENPLLWTAAKAFSLVYSFDVETLEGEQAELPRLASLSGLSANDLFAHQAELHRRQIIQRRANWAALLPHALAHKLAKEALQDFPTKSILDALVDRKSSRLLLSFSRRLGCLHDSPEAKSIVSQWLSPQGWLGDWKKIDDLGMTVLANIAPVDPLRVIEILEKAIDENDLVMEEYSLRRHILELIRALAYDPLLFDRSVSILVKFMSKAPTGAAREDALRLFKSLFYLYLSGTHALASQRAQLLFLLAESNQENIHDIVLTGLEAMLECQNFTSSYSFEFGTRKRDYGLNPKTDEEFLEWYQQAFALVAKLVENANFSADVLRMLAKKFRHLTMFRVLTEEALALGNLLATRGGWPEGHFAVNAAIYRIRKNSPERDLSGFEALALKTSVSSLHEKIRAYVLHDHAVVSHYSDEDLEGEGKFEKAKKRLDDVYYQIGSELAGDLEQLKHYIHDMIIKNSPQLWELARGLGKNVENPMQAREIILSVNINSMTINGISRLLNGFISGLAESNRAIAEKFVEDALTNTALHQFFIGMQIALGIDTIASERIIRAAELPSIPTHSFAFAAYGRACDSLPLERFKAMLLAIFARGDGLRVVVEMAHLRMYSSQSRKSDLPISEVEIGRQILDLVTFNDRTEIDQFAISCLIKECLTEPTDKLIAERLCRSMVKGVLDHKVSFMDCAKIIDAISGIFPRVVLDIIVDEGEGEFERQGRIFMYSARDYATMLQGIPEDILLEWSLEKPDRRLLLLTSFIRPFYSTEAGSYEMDIDDVGASSNLAWTPKALSMLRHSDNPETLLERFLEYFTPSSYSPPLSRIMDSRVPLLESLSKDENAKVALAAANQLVLFKEAIVRQKDFEANSSKERDERFEW